MFYQRGVKEAYLELVFSMFYRRGFKEAYLELVLSMFYQRAWEEREGRRGVEPRILMYWRWLEYTTF